MNTLIIGMILVVAVAALIFWVVKRKPREVQIVPTGARLPEFSLQDDSGNPVGPADLSGQAAVLIFLRGSWCPFCNSQVKDLTAQYKAIGEAGARLIFVTPKPQDTTRRVAELFDVDLTFWVDENLVFADALQLRAKNSVPAELRKRFGPDTVLPTSLVLDKDGVVRFSVSHCDVRSRPRPDHLLAELKKL